MSDLKRDAHKTGLVQERGGGFKITVVDREGTIPQPKMLFEDSTYKFLTKKRPKSAFGQSVTAARLWRLTLQDGSWKYTHKDPAGPAPPTTSLNPNAEKAGSSRSSRATAIAPKLMSSRASSADSKFGAAGQAGSPRTGRPTSGVTAPLPSRFSSPSPGVEVLKGKSQSGTGIFEKTATPADFADEILVITVSSGPQANAKIKIMLRLETLLKLKGRLGANRNYTLQYTQSIYQLRWTTADNNNCSITDIEFTKSRYIERPNSRFLVVGTSLRFAGRLETLVPGRGQWLHPPNSGPRPANGATVPKATLLVTYGDKQFRVSLSNPIAGANLQLYDVIPTNPRTGHPEESVDFRMDLQQLDSSLHLKWTIGNKAYRLSGLHFVGKQYVQRSGTGSALTIQYVYDRLNISA